MPAVAPLPPQAVRELLEASGYEVIAEDEYNWAFAKGEDDEPVMVPKEVDLIPVEIAFHIARKVGFNGYFDKLHEVAAKSAQPSTDPIH